jgi:putative FmdB family regulatory protein
MPIYEYICEDCHTHFEKIVFNKQQEIACPKCAGKRNAIQLSVFSAGNGSANSSANSSSAKSSNGFSGGGGGCCGGGCACH